MTHVQTAKVDVKNMLGNDILNFFRTVLEDKVEKCKWKLLVAIVEVTNFVVRDHMKFIKETLIKKQDVLLDWGIFLID
jgi:hypothetical protein